MTIEEAINTIEWLDVHINDALESKVAPVVKHEISDAVVGQYVYGAHDPIPVFYASRRGRGSGGIGDESVMESHVYDMTLTITDTSQLQNLWSDTWQADVATIVQEGSKQFHQPKPRPFMEEAVRDAIDSGKIDQALRDGLAVNGLIVD